MRIYTLRNHLEHAVEALKDGPHPEKADRDSEFLLLHLLRKNRAWLIAHPRKELSEEQQDLYEEIIRRRLSGEPVQYIAGETEFYGLPFRVTPDVLIPRPETEHLVERAIQLAAEFTQPRIVDVGTGSGAIAVALATHLQDARITSIDVPEKALAVARENAERNGVSERMRFLAGDLLGPVAGEQFELVVSNPPYVPEADRASLSVEVRDYEPGVALFAGEDGLDVYRRLIPAAYNVLAPGGYVLMEIGYRQAEGVRALLAGSGFEAIQFIPDLQGIARVACGKRESAAPVVK
jgi:release factor glutamine methyltransferase